MSLSDFYNILLSSAYPLLKGALLTVQVSAAAIAGGGILGTLLGIANSNKLKVAGISRAINVYVTVMRGTPVFVQLFLIYFAVPEALGTDLSPIAAGVLTLGLNSAAYLAEIVRAGINTVPVGQWEACHSLGYSTVASLRYVIGPQALKNVLPAIANEFVTLVKESSILMVLGVPELTKVSKDIVARELKPVEIYLTTALLYLALTTTVSFVFKKLEGDRHDSH